MVNTYSELIEKRQNGETLNWESVSKEQLSALFFTEYVTDNMIAELYNTTKSKVRYKRQKLALTMNSTEHYDNLINEFLDKNPQVNKDLKENILNAENIPKLAIALTHYLYRNGPVEDMHANGQLSDRDMKTMNKYMVNRIAGLLRILKEGNWMKIALLMDLYKYSGTNWDPVEYDTEEIDEYFKICMNRK